METTTLTRRQAAAFRDSMKARLVAAGFAHYVEDADDFKAAR